MSSEGVIKSESGLHHDDNTTTVVYVSFKYFIFLSLKFNILVCVYIDISWHIECLKTIYF